MNQQESLMVLLNWVVAVSVAWSVGNVLAIVMSYKTKLGTWPVHPLEVRKRGYFGLAVLIVVWAIIGLAAVIGTITTHHAWFLFA